MFELILLILLWLHIVIQLLILAANRVINQPERKIASFPFVSILVAARNEENNIETCLKSLLALNVPKENYEILVGNDGSTDHTPLIVERLSGSHPCVKLFTITEQLGTAKAKANVLAHLVHMAKGDYVFVTDADIQVSPNWVSHIIPYLLEPNVGIVSGTTLVEGSGLFEKMQDIEWLLANGNLIGFDSLGIKSTAVGNNMAFSKEAYFKTGGYEHIPFSVTEDFQLFKYIRKLGYKTYNLANASSLNISKAQTNLLSLLHQRKRWMIGGEGLPKIWWCIFLISGLYAPAIIILCFIHFKLALMIGLFKFLLQSVFILILQFRLKRNIKLFHIVLFEPYEFFVNLLMTVFYLLPYKMQWKGRPY